MTSFYVLDYGFFRKACLFTVGRATIYVFVPIPGQGLEGVHPFEFFDPQPEEIDSQDIGLGDSRLQSSLWRRACRVVSCRGSMHFDRRGREGLTASVPTYFVAVSVRDTTI